LALKATIVSVAERLERALRGEANIDEGLEAIVPREDRRSIRVDALRAPKLSQRSEDAVRVQVHKVSDRDAVYTSGLWWEDLVRRG
jgi:hypothetical protein